MNEQELIDAALGLTDTAERSRYLSKACGSDESLRCHIEGLLAIKRQLGDIQGTSLSSSVAHHEAAINERPGMVIGPYKLLELIGDGGMGTVWMAEQTQPVSRRVALKLVKPDLASEQFLARFEAERQAMALMDHPNIAHVFDAGATPAGRPYFVMELVKGVSITRYCDEKRLQPRDRLELFMSVCLAVNHAHQKGVIHRDLKPSNILVAPYDGKPVVKIIDFGVAKAAGRKLTDKTLFTRFGAVVGTPEYMSPEQAELNNRDVDTRSDIYSLGVLLYELLTGTTPLTNARVKETALLELLRVIREDEPPKPSARLSSTQELPAIAEKRGLDAAILSGVLRGELDWIVMKALEKDRDRRYESASEMAHDVHRYLSDEPVLAGPPSPGYRLKKFVHRNRPQVIAAGIVMLALVAGLVGTTLGLIEAKRQERMTRDAREDERQARQREFERADGERLAKLAALQAQKKEEEQRKIAEQNEQLARTAQKDTEAFLRFISKHFFASARPQGLMGGIGINVTISDALTAAEKHIDSEFHNRPLLEARVRHEFGVTWQYLERYANSEKHLRRVVALQEEHLGPTDPITLNSINNLALTLSKSGQNERAMVYLEQVLRVREEQLGPDHLDTVLSRGTLAGAYQAAGKLEKAIPLLEQVFASRKKKLGANHAQTLTSMNNLATAYYSAGMLDRSMPLIEEAYQLCKAHLESDHALTVHVMFNLGINYKDTGRLQEALPLLELSLQASRRYPSLRIASAHLQDAYVLTGQSAKAITLAREQYAEDKAGSMLQTAQMLLKAKEWDDAEKVLRKLLSIHEKEKPNAWTTFQLKYLLGNALLGQKKHVEAEPLLVEGYHGLQQRADSIPPLNRFVVGEVLDKLIQLNSEIKKPEVVKKWQLEKEKLKAAVTKTP